MKSKEIVNIIIQENPDFNSIKSREDYLIYLYKKIFIPIYKDMKELLESRNPKMHHSFIQLIKETNNKFLAINNKLENYYKVKIFNDDAFLNALKFDVPELKDYL